MCYGVVEYYASLATQPMCGVWFNISSIKPLESYRGLEIFYFYFYFWSRYEKAYKSAYDFLSPWQK